MFVSDMLFVIILHPEKMESKISLQKKYHEKTNSFR